MHVMLIDDNPLVVNNISRLLLLNGFSNEAYTDPVRAVDAFTVCGFDVVVTDYKMPSMNGIEVMRKIRKQRPDTRIVVLSENRDCLDELLPDEWVDAIFPKPVVMGSFMNLLSLFARESEAGLSHTHARMA